MVVLSKGLLSKKEMIFLLACEINKANMKGIAFRIKLTEPTINDNVVRHRRVAGSHGSMETYKIKIKCHCLVTNVNNTNPIMNHFSRN